MSFSSGQYSITSRAGNFPIGRNPREDLSLNPKRVITLPQGVQPPAWEIQRVNNGNYILRIGGRPTATFDHLLWAILLDDPRPSEWKIQAQPQAGPNTFTIGLANGPEGWVVPNPDQDDTQIAVRPLIVGPSDPPFFPPNELFVILPIRD